MTIVDAHLHFAADEYMDRTAEAAGHRNTPEHLARVFRDCGVAAGIVMGHEGAPVFPADAPPLYFCFGLRARELDDGTAAAAELVRAETALRRPDCVGIKIYLGYDCYYPADPRFHPFYELAEACGKTVVFHTGDTAGGHGKLKYAHPLNVDDAASDFPDTRFVLAHCGNPWIVDAVEVAAKNPNVTLDLSGLASGNFEPDELYARYEAYWRHLRMWLDYLSDDSRAMYGSDWPLVNIPAYIALMRRVVPERAHEAFFHDNAVRVFRLTGA